jgi:hypothetical protein
MKDSPGWVILVKFIQDQIDNRRRERDAVIDEEILNTTLKNEMLKREENAFRTVLNCPEWMIEQLKVQEEECRKLMPTEGGEDVKETWNDAP